MRTTPPIAERIFVVLALSVFSWALIPLLQYKSGFTLNAAEGNRLVQAMVLPIYLVTGGVALWHWRSFLGALAAHKLTLLLVGIALLSVLWSTAPEITLRRSVALVGTTLFGIYLVTRFDDRGVLEVLAWTLGPAAVLSLLFAVALPGYGLDEGVHQGAWRGIYPDKNSFGRIMALGTLVFLLLALGGGRYRWLKWGGAALSAALVVLSTSSSALVLMIGMVTLVMLYFTLRWHYRVLVPWLIAVVLVATSAALVLVANLEAFFALLGRDPTLTGRTTLWAAVVSSIADRPWLGHGYSGFWLGASGPAGEVWSAVRWTPPHAHNGFLDLWLDLGVVGVVCFGLGFAVAAAWAFRRVRATRTADGLWPLVFLTFTLLYNLTESTLLQQNNVFWVLYVAAAVAAVRWPAPAVEAASEEADEGALAPVRRRGTPALSPGVRRHLKRMRRPAPLHPLSG